jgi:ABC-type transport system substrate-binding protein
MFITDGGNNQTGWSHAQYDTLIAQAKEETDPRRRGELYHQAEAILMDELPIIPVFFDVSTSMSGSYVSGVFPNYHDIHPLKAIRVDAARKARQLAGELHE